MPYNYQTYAGADIVATIHMPLLSNDAIVIGSLQTITYSIHREVTPVRSLGRIYPKGFTSGPATIAGSLIFTVFNKSVVYSLMTQLQTAYRDAKIRSHTRQTTQKDELLISYMDRINYIKAGAPTNLSDSQMQFYNWQTTESFHTTMNTMPPFDITLTFGNEYGTASTMVIEGVVIVDEGQVMSIEDILTEQTFSYMASGIQPMRPLGSWDFNEDKSFSDTRFNAEIYVPKDITASNFASTLSFDYDEVALAVGEDMQLSAILNPPIAPPEDLRWRVAHGDIASISNVINFGTQATVTGLAIGKTTVTATLFGETAECTFQIGPIAPESITLPATDTVTAGSDITLVPVFDEEATYFDVNWVSDDEDVATVTSGGVVTGIIPGLANITVSSLGYPQVNDTCAVTVEAL